MARPRKLLRRLLTITLGAVLAFYCLITLTIIALRWTAPPTTAVQIERRVQAWSRPARYHKESAFRSLAQISNALPHAVVAAEDARFYQHHGFDVIEIQNAINERQETGRKRGASTITQQLVKNLFLTTSPTLFRKGVEAAIVPIVELLLGKQRILELYLNVIEWGPGIYGAEAAARHYYNIPARSLTREQAIELAALIPAPLRRKPGRNAEYSGIIAARMAQMGW